MAAPQLIPVYDSKGEPLPPSVHQTVAYNSGNAATYSPALYHVPSQSEAYHAVLMTADKPSVPLDIAGSHMLPPKSAKVAISVTEPTTVMFGHLIEGPSGGKFNHTGATVKAQPSTVAHLNPSAWPSNGTSLFLAPGDHTIDVDLKSGAHSSFDHSLVGHTSASLLETATQRPSGRCHVETSSALGQIMTKYPMASAEPRTLDNGAAAIAFDPEEAKKHLDSILSSHTILPSFAFQTYPPLPVKASVTLSYGEPPANSTPNATFATDRTINVVPRGVVDALKRDAMAAKPQAAAAAPAFTPATPAPMSPPLQRSAAFNPLKKATSDISGFTMGRRNYRDTVRDVDEDEDGEDDQREDDGDASPPTRRSNSSRKHGGRR
jgi:hypothetical protein